MKRQIVLPFAMLLFLVACGAPRASNSYHSNLIKSSSMLPNENIDSSFGTDYDAENEFDANGFAPADYSLAPTQIVNVGDTIEPVNLMSFSSGTSDFVSQGRVALLSAERVSDKSALNTAAWIYESEKTSDTDLILVTMNIENIGEANADFCVNGTIYSVSPDNLLARTDYDHCWSSFAYCDDGTGQAPNSTCIPLDAGESITVTVGCAIPKEAPTEGEKLYWELNPHGDSFFYPTGRTEVWFVELDI